MHWNPLSGAKLEDVFGPFDKNVTRAPRRRKASGKKTKADFKIEKLEQREVPAIDVGLAASSLASTSGNNATIGEIVRVRAVVPLGGDTNVYSSDAVFVTASPTNGLQYLDGTARIALISDGGITSTLGSGAYVAGSSATGVTPTFAINPVVSDGQLRFNTGITSVFDDDVNGEFAVIEYNALVTNTAGNVAGTALATDFSLNLGVQANADSGTGSVTITEPAITNLAKSVSTSSPSNGQAITVTITFSNPATASTAYEVSVFDTLPTGLMIDPTSITVVGGTGPLISSTGATTRYTFSELAPGAAVTITYTARVTAVTGTTLTSDLNLNYTSLPGDNGTTPNPTGSNTPGTPGSPTGERDAYSGYVANTIVVGGQGGGGNAISGSVFLDADLSGDYTATDPWLADIQIDLYTQAGVFLRLTTTDVNGFYIFTGLADGVYRVVQPTQPTGFTDYKEFVGDRGGNTGPNEGIGSDFIENIDVRGNYEAHCYDFSERPGKAELSGYVYIDENLSCSRDAGDTPIQGVTVTLTGTTTAGQAVSLTTTTNADGFYRFADLEAGTYTVNETQPANLDDYCETAGTTGGTVGPNMGIGTDTISAIPLTLNGNSQNNNFGERRRPGPANAQLSGYVYFDVNLSKSRDAGDLPIPNITMTLTGTATDGTPVTRTTTTDSTGFYKFTDLPAGTYKVTEGPTVDFIDFADQPGSTGGTTPAVDGIGSDMIQAIPLVDGDNSINNNFGETKDDVPLPAMLSGFVYVDNDRSLSFNTGDTPIPNVSMTLTGTAADGTAITRTTTTDSTGFYKFDNLPAGTYKVTETQPAAFDDFGDQPGTTGGTTPNVNGLGSDMIQAIPLQLGQNSQQNNFGEVPKPVVQPAQLSGYVYVDVDKSKSRNAGDTPIAGALVALQGTATDGTAILRYATTDAAGFYSFTNLPAGTYSVFEAQPAGLMDFGDQPGTTGGTVPMVDGIGSDALLGITLVPGANSQNNNFGEMTTPPPQPAQLSGFVYVDVDKSKSFNAGDTPIAGVLVAVQGTATDGTSVLRYTTTDATGFYSFTNLPAGIYNVFEAQPAGLMDFADQPGTTGGTVPTMMGLASDTIQAIPLVPGANSQNNNFGEMTTPPPQPAQLSGFVYVDVDKSKSFNAGDTPIAGVLVAIQGTATDGTSVLRYTTTDATGFYSFTNLPAGIYNVFEAQPAGLMDFADQPGTTGGTVPTMMGLASDTIQAIPLVPGANSQNNNFGEMTPPAPQLNSVSGYVFCYTGDNPFRTGSATTPLSGVSVILSGTTTGGVAVRQTTTTNAAGFYTFTGLANGTYRVNEIQPAANFVPNQVISDGLDSTETLAGVNATINVSDVHSMIVLTGAASETLYNFGEICTGLSPDTAQLSGFVYFDRNRNCVYDQAAGDLPIAFVTVTLTGTRADGTPVQIVTQTNESGFYLFRDLGAGTYTVTETQPPAYQDYCENPGTTGGVTGPNNGIGGPNTISAIPLAAGQQSERNNFGEVTTDNRPPNPNPNPLPVPIGKQQFLSSTRTGSGTGTTTTIVQSPTFANAASRTGRGTATSQRLLVTGADAGGAPLVSVYDFQRGVKKFDILAYDRAFTGGVRVATADVTGDGVADIITVPGAGGAAHVKVFDGNNGQLVRQFFAYDTGFMGGAFVAAADVDGNGVADIVTGTGDGGVPSVKVFNTVGQFAEFFAFDRAFRGGVRVAAADFNADGRAEIATGAGTGGMPLVTIFDVNGGTATATRSFLAFDAAFRGGVFLAANGNAGAGDATGDGRADLVVSAGAGGGAFVNTYSGVDFSRFSSFLAFSDFAGGVRVGLFDMNGDGRADVVAGTGSGRGAFVRVVDLTTGTDLEFFQAYNPAFLGGTFVAGA